MQDRTTHKDKMCVWFNNKQVGLQEKIGGHHGCTRKKALLAGVEVCERGAKRRTESILSPKAGDHNLKGSNHKSEPESVSQVHHNFSSSVLTLAGFQKMARSVACALS